MYKDGLLFLGKTHINNSCRAKRPVADNNKNKNNDINNSYQDRRPPDQKDMIIHIKQSEKDNIDKYFANTPHVANNCTKRNFVKSVT